MIIQITWHWIIQEQDKLQKQLSENLKKKLSSSGHIVDAHFCIQLDIRTAPRESEEVDVESLEELVRTCKMNDTTEEANNFVFENEM